MSFIHGRRLLGAVLSAVLVFVLVGCGSGGDDPTATTDAVDSTPTTAATAASTDSTPDASPVAQATATPTTAPTESATATPTESPATATAAPTVAATATTATTATTAPTATPAATATVGFEEDPFADVETLDPELLPNYSVDFRLELEGLSEEEDSTVEMEIRQSAVDNYYLRINADGLIVESWLVDGVNYLRQEDGTILSIPGGIDAGFFSPSMFLSTTPTLDPDLRAQRVGEETVSGRSTTHYRIAGIDYLGETEFFGQETVPTDIRGDADVWIDNELFILIRQEAAFTWTNSDGTPGRFVSNYLMDNIGSTPRIESPQ